MVSSFGWLGLDPITQLGMVTPHLGAAIRRDLHRRPDTTWAGWTYRPDLLGWQDDDGLYLLPEVLRNDGLMFARIRLVSMSNLSQINGIS